jgi:hypothetical protein
VAYPLCIHSFIHTLCGECVFCMNGYVGLMVLVYMCACILCSDVYSTAVCWRGAVLCVLMFCVVIMYGVEYRIFGDQAILCSCVYSVDARNKYGNL